MCKKLTQKELFWLVRKNVEVCKKNESKASDKYLFWFCQGLNPDSPLLPFKAANIQYVVNLHVSLKKWQNKYKRSHWGSSPKPYTEMPFTRAVCTTRVVVSSVSYTICTKYKMNSFLKIWAWFHLLPSHA